MVITHGEGSPGEHGFESLERQQSQERGAGILEESDGMG